MEEIMTTTFYHSYGEAVFLILSLIRRTDSFLDWCLCWDPDEDGVGWWFLIERDEDGEGWWFLIERDEDGEGWLFLIETEDKNSGAGEWLCSIMVGEPWYLWIDTDGDWHWLGSWIWTGDVVWDRWRCCGGVCTGEVGDITDLYIFNFLRV